MFDEDCVGKKSCQISFNREHGIERFDHENDWGHKKQIDLNHLNRKIFPNLGVLKESDMYDKCFRRRSDVFV